MYRGISAYDCTYECMYISMHTCLCTWLLSPLMSAPPCLADQVICMQCVYDCLCVCMQACYTWAKIDVSCLALGHRTRRMYNALPSFDRLLFLMSVHQRTIFREQFSRIWQSKHSSLLRIALWIIMLRITQSVTLSPTGRSSLTLLDTQRHFVLWTLDTVTVCPYGLVVIRMRDPFPS